MWAQPISLWVALKVIYTFLEIIIWCCAIHIPRVVASTQFEPTSARAAFPCFDEPAFKTNFSVQIRREAKHIALSNMPKVCYNIQRTSSYQSCCFLTKTWINHKVHELLICHWRFWFFCWATLLFLPQLRTLELPGGLFEDQFDVSVKMSTYLVAFIVSDFLSISKTSQHGVQVRRGSVLYH